MKILSAIEEQKKLMKTYSENLYSVLFSLDNVDFSMVDYIIEEITRVKKYITLLTKTQALVWDYPEINIDIENLTEFMIMCYLKQLDEISQQPIRDLLNKLN